MIKIKDLVSPIDRSGWMADVLTQHVDQKKSPFARSIILTAIANLEKEDHKRLYEQLLNTFYNEK